MKTELINKNINQYFGDIIYYSTPTYTKKYKILIIIGFDFVEKKSKLCSIILLENENIETFYTIFKFLSNNYKFAPKYITIDFSKALHNGIKKVYSKTIILICFEI